MSTPHWIGACGLVGLLALQSCAAPSSLKPVVTAPLQETWQGSPPETTSAQELPTPQAWWQVFHDPQLNHLMRVALLRNLDIKLAEARIAQARAQERASAAALWPDINVSLQDQFGHSVTTPPGSEFSLLGALNVSWAVDIFGTLRNQRRAAAAAARAAEFDREATQITLLAEVASNYIQYRLYQLEYVISSRNAASQEETVRITRLRFDQGAASRLDLEQLTSQLAITRAAVPQAYEQAQQARATLTALLASTPESLAMELPEAMPENPNLPSGDPVTVLLTPAQMMLQRPDIRSAQESLVAANASLRAAAAQRFPQLSLAGLIGQEANHWATLPTAGGRAREYSAGLVTPLFDFGRIRAGIDLASAQQRQAYLIFEQTVRQALQATQSAIVLYTQGALRARELQTALDSARTASRLARRQYQEGALALLNVLDAERTEYATELEWAESVGAESVRLVTLYQTMGVLPPPALSSW